MILSLKIVLLEYIVPYFAAMGKYEKKITKNKSYKPYNPYSKYTDF